MHIHKITCLRLREYSCNTFTKDLLNGWGCKNQQNFDNRKIFVLWRNSQPSIKLFERELEFR